MKTALIITTLALTLLAGESTPYRVDRVSAHPDHLYLVCNDTPPHSCLGVEGEPKPHTGLGAISSEAVPTRPGYPADVLWWFTDSRGIRYRALGW